MVELVLGVEGSLDGGVEVWGELGAVWRFSGAGLVKEVGGFFKIHGFEGLPESLSFEGEGETVRGVGTQDESVDASGFQDDVDFSLFGLSVPLGFKLCAVALGSFLFVVGEIDVRDRGWDGVCLDHRVEEGACVVGDDGVVWVWGALGVVGDERVEGEGTGAVEGCGLAEEFLVDVGDGYGLLVGEVVDVFGILRPVWKDCHGVFAQKEGDILRCGGDILRGGGDILRRGGCD